MLSLGEKRRWVISELLLPCKHLFCRKLYVSCPSTTIGVSFSKPKHGHWSQAGSLGVSFASRSLQVPHLCNFRLGGSIRLPNHLSQ